MKVQSLFEDITAPMTPKMEASFTNLFNRIHAQVQGETGISISPKWLAGFLNQSHNFKYLDHIYKGQLQSGRGDAKDTKARIIARDLLGQAKLLDPKNGYLPLKKSTLSVMRQFYSDSAREQTGANDMAKHTREAGAQEYDEWFNALSDEHKNYVTQLQELNADEWSSFKGIIHAKQNRQQFVTRLYQLAYSDDVAHNILQSMKMITPENKLSTKNIEKLRTFLSSVSDSRLKDILSKQAVYAGKSAAHANARSSNAVLKGIDNEPNGRYSMMLKLYHYISRKVGQSEDKERAFRRMLEKIPQAHDQGGQPNEIGKGAYTLFKQFGGRVLDPEAAIATLNKLSGRHNQPADLPHRAEKASGRNDSIRKVGEI